MTKLIDFYFDFISPYSYIAHKKIIKLNKRDSFNYKAILLGGLHNLGNITAPAFNERKMKNMREDCILISKKNNIDISNNENIRKILADCEIKEDLFFEGIKNQPIKDKLKKLTNHAFERNVFGAPTFYVNNKLFWGQDRLEYALDEYIS